MKNDFYNFFTTFMSGLAIWLIASTASILDDTGHHVRSVVGIVMVAVWLLGATLNDFHNAWTKGVHRFGPSPGKVFAITVVFCVIFGVATKTSWSTTIVGTTVLMVLATIEIELARRSPYKTGNPSASSPEATIRGLHQRIEYAQAHTVELEKRIRGVIDNPTHPVYRTEFDVSVEQIRADLMLLDAGLLTLAIRLDMPPSTLTGTPGATG